jgi:hypothetical protein
MTKHTWEDSDSAQSEPPPVATFDLLYAKLNGSDDNFRLLSLLAAMLDGMPKGEARGVLSLSRAGLYWGS